TARIIAKFINCQKPTKDLEPCGRCSMCVSFANDAFLDLMEIDAASNRGIDDVRGLKERAILAPSMGKYKVYIIDEVHMMTKEAFNALLKLLEEPPAHCLFILCTTEKEKIPATIVSRCQPSSLKRAGQAAIVAKLAFIVKQEKAKVSQEDLDLIARESDGGFRDAENMLEQVVKGGLKVEDLLGGITDREIFEFLELLSRTDTKKLILKINGFFNNGVDLEVFLKVFLGAARNLMYFKIKADKELFEGLEEAADRYRELVDKFTLSDLRRLLAVFGNCVARINKNPFPPLILELAVLDYGAKPTACEDIPPVLPQTTPSVSKAKVSNDTLPFSWESFLTKVKPYNHSLEALLRSCRLISFEDNNLLLEAFYPFHKERLESIQCKKILQDVLVRDFDISASNISFVLGSVVKEKPKKPEKVEETKAFDVFNGEL
ncbi:MAG: DNA polymerase III subunit gamma/tau, partial [bacterium]